MPNPLESALSSLQMLPQQSGPDLAAQNARIINQFNHASAHDRTKRSADKMTPPNHDALLQKLHSIDALLMQGKMADQSRFKPETLKLAQTAQMIGKPDLAYNILNEENRKIISRDAIGGAPLSTMAWERLRDAAGRKAIERHGAVEEQSTGPISTPGGMMQASQVNAAMASPSAKDDLYRIGVESFDRQFGKHKHYLVEDNLAPNSGTPPQVNPSVAPSPGTASIPPGLDAIVHNAGVIGHQQQGGAPTLPPQQFAQKLQGAS